MATHSGILTIGNPMDREAYIVHHVTRVGHVVLIATATSIAPKAAFGRRVAKVIAVLSVPVVSYANAMRPWTMAL